MRNPLDPSAAHIVAYLDGLPPSFRFGDLRQAKVIAFPLALLAPFATLRGCSARDFVRELQSAGGAPKG